MVSAVELEIAMSIIQLVGITLPILLGLVRFYLNDQEIIDDILESHPEVVEGARFSDFLLPITAALFISYFFAYLLIASNSHVFITMALAGYATFLIYLSLSIMVGVGNPVLGPIKRLAVGTVKFVSGLLAVSVALAALLGYGPLAVVLGIFLFAVLVASGSAWAVYRYGKARESEAEPQSKDRDDECNEVRDEPEMEPTEDEVHHEK